MPDQTREFSTETAGLGVCVPSEVVELSGGDVFELEIAAVSNRLGDATVRMLAYNGSIPGPTLKVRQGSQLIVNVTNRGDHADTVHWHGLRLDNRSDGTHETQAPIPIGGASPTSSSSPILASTGTTRMSARTTARSLVCTATSLSSPTRTTTGRRSTARSRSRWTTS